MPIRKGSREAHERSVKGWETRRRNAAQKPRIVPVVTPRKKNHSMSQQTQTRLKPIRTDLPYRASDPAAAPDPQYLLQAYGAQQLQQALQVHSREQLQRTVKAVQARYPGTKPSGQSKAAFIAYIIKHTSKHRGS